MPECVNFAKKLNKASNPYPVLASTYACKKSDFIVRLREPLQRTFVLRFEWPIQQPEWNSSSVSKDQRLRY